MDRDEERLIRERAYEIWEREGRPVGRAEEHWQRAAAEIAAQRSPAPPAPEAAPASDPAPERTPAPATRRSRPVPRREGSNGTTSGRRKPASP
jgi:hypothetical protein